MRRHLAKRINENYVEWDVGTDPHPLIGAMTKKDWLVFLTTHMDRHIHQINQRVCQYQYA